MNTILLGATVAGPGLSAFVRQQWAEYQAAKSQRIAQAQAAAAATRAAARDASERQAMLAAQAQAISHAWPPDTLAFAEDFPAGSLPQFGATSATIPTSRQSAGTAAAAALPSPAFWPQLGYGGFSARWWSTQAVLFLHARRARPDSPDRLILLTTTLDPDSDKRRAIYWTTYELTAIRGGVQELKSTGVVIDLPKTIRPRGDAIPPLRFYAGQSDPADHSRFTIRYEFGLGVGTIACRLLSDDRIELTVDGPLAPIVH